MQAGTLKAHLETQERLLLEQANRRNTELVASLLLDDFQEYGASGRVHTKSEILAQLAEVLPLTLTAHSFELTLAAADVALLTYRSTKTTDAGSTHALRSSLWVLSGETWRMLFHQGTPTAA